VKTACPFDSVALSAPPPSTERDTVPVGVPDEALTATVTAAFEPAEMDGALIVSLVGIAPEPGGGGGGGGDDSAKVAVMVVVADTVTLHEPVPEQPPPVQPPNVDPAAGAAARVTAVPLA